MYVPTALNKWFFKIHFCNASLQVIERKKACWNHWTETSVVKGRWPEENYYRRRWNYNNIEYKKSMKVREKNESNIYSIWWWKLLHDDDLSRNEILGQDGRQWKLILKDMEEIKSLNLCSECMYENDQTRKLVTRIYFMTVQPAGQKEK